MFGGAGLYRQGIMFGLIADDKAYLRVDDSNRKSFEDAGSEPFHPYGKKVTMPYYEVPIEVLEDQRDFCAWAEKALAAAAAREGTGAEDARKAEALARELTTLKREREEIRDRVEKLVGLLESL